MKKKICPMCRNNIQKELNELLKKEEKKKPIEEFSFSNHDNYYTFDRLMRNDDLRNLIFFFY